MSRCLLSSSDIFTFVASSETYTYFLKNLNNIVNIICLIASASVLMLSHVSTVDVIENVQIYNIIYCVIIILTTNDSPKP